MGMRGGKEESYGRFGASKSWDRLDIVNGGMMPRIPSPHRHLWSNDPWKKERMLSKAQNLHATDHSQQGLHQLEGVRGCSTRKPKVIGAPNWSDLLTRCRSVMFHGCDEFLLQPIIAK